MRFAVARIGGTLADRPTAGFHTEFTQLAALRLLIMAPRSEAGMSPAAIEFLRKVSHRYAYAPSLYKYAMAQALNGDVAGARITLIQLRRLHGDVRYGEAQREIADLAVANPVLRPLVSP